MEKRRKNNNKRERSLEWKYKTTIFVELLQLCNILLNNWRVSWRPRKGLANPN